MGGRGGGAGVAVYKDSTGNFMKNEELELRTGAQRNLANGAHSEAKQAWAAIVWKSAQSTLKQMAAKTIANIEARDVDEPLEIFMLLLAGNEKSESGQAFAHTARSISEKSIQIAHSSYECRWSRCRDLVGARSSTVAEIDGFLRFDGGG
ncbi:hypothetical protein Tco_1246532 [Tanacetum coccineum]